VGEERKKKSTKHSSPNPLGVLRIGRVEIGGGNIVQPCGKGGGRKGGVSPNRFARSVNKTHGSESQTGGYCSGQELSCSRHNI